MCVIYLDGPKSSEAAAKYGCARQLEHRKPGIAYTPKLRCCNERSAHTVCGDSHAADALRCCPAAHADVVCVVGAVCCTRCCVLPDARILCSTVATNQASTPNALCAYSRHSGNTDQPTQAPTWPARCRRLAWACPFLRRLCRPRPSASLCPAITKPSLQRCQNWQLSMVAVANTDVDELKRTPTGSFAREVACFFGAPWFASVLVGSAFSSSLPHTVSCRTRHTDGPIRCSVAIPSEAGPQSHARRQSTRTTCAPSSPCCLPVACTPVASREVEVVDFTVASLAWLPAGSEIEGYG